MVFKYICPSLNEKNLEAIVSVFADLRKLREDKAAYWKKRADIYASDRYITTKWWDAAFLDREYAHVLIDPIKIANSAFEKIKPLIQPFVHDLFTTHIVPGSDNLYYRNARLFHRYVGEKVVKPFLGPSDVWTAAGLKLPVNNSPAPLR